MKITIEEGNSIPQKFAIAKPENDKEHWDYYRNDIHSKRLTNGKLAKAHLKLEVLNYIDKVYEL